jgi:CRP-like cAMP-binding protein
MPVTIEQASRNRILAGVGKRLEPVLRDLEPIRLEVRHMLLEADKPFRHVFFVQSGVMSVIARGTKKEQLEVATVGSEGMVGLPAFLGSKHSAMTAFAQIPGEALRMPVERFMRHCEEIAQLRQAMLRYTQAFITQIAQNSACNRLHPVQERCARWLLLTHDRVDSDEFPLTQEFLAQMLGVRRPSVTVAAGALQQAGLIEYTRGSIRVVDRAGLEEASCECYSIVEAEYRRLLGAAPDRRKKRSIRHR